MESERFSKTRDSLKADLSRVDNITKKTIEVKLPEDMFSISNQKANQLAYKTMNPVIYYSLTFILYIVEVILSICLNDIG